MEYNGWKNYETWNVALWIGSDYPLYRASEGYKTYPQPYLSLRDDLRKGMLKCTTTGDGVSLWDRRLDVEALDDMIRAQGGCEEAEIDGTSHSYVRACGWCGSRYQDYASALWYCSDDCATDARNRDAITAGEVD